LTVTSLEISKSPVDTAEIPAAGPEAGPNAVIRYEPDGYVVDREKLLGRHSAGNGFLRAAVHALRGQTLYGYTPGRRSAESFAKLVSSLDPDARHQWVPAARLDMLAEVGTVYLPGPDLSAAARLRLRLSSLAYSLVGVTHTTATHRAMDAITGMVTSPVMPWDALICTSNAVKSHVTSMLEAEVDYLQWRIGRRPQIWPQLPVIPLGVHCDDFAISQAERQSARAALGIADDEVVALFVGRLSFHAKAHPHAMYVGLEAAARETKRKLVLIECGWFVADSVEKAFKDGAKKFCPTVRSLYADGRKADERGKAWAAADLFVSLSDNIQETFGLTPVEAMAAGLPVVVTDWDGYKETVRDGIDGFRIHTALPASGLGHRFAAGYEAGSYSYDSYAGYTCHTVSVDYDQLRRRLSELILNPALRQSQGSAGQQRARSDFDWKVLFRRYQDLWAELAAMRTKLAADPAWRQRVAAAPRFSPSRMDPFQGFANYPTHIINSQTRVRWVADAPSYGEMVTHPLFSYAKIVMPNAELVELLRKSLDGKAMSVEELAEANNLRVANAIIALAALAKMGLIKLEA
jgi:glycosyltransferase involved in cell wall biosynthesis